VLLVFVEYYTSREDTRLTDRGRFLRDICFRLRHHRQGEDRPNIGVLLPSPLILEDQDALLLLEITETQSPRLS